MLIVPRSKSCYKFVNHHTVSLPFIFMNLHTGAFVIFLQPLEKMQSLIFLCIVIYLLHCSIVPPPAIRSHSAQQWRCWHQHRSWLLPDIRDPADNGRGLLSSDGGYFVNISDSYFIFQLPVFVMLDI
jgi:hypothetical protein